MRLLLSYFYLFLLGSGLAWADATTAVPEKLQGLKSALVLPNFDPKAYWSESDAAKKEDFSWRKSAKSCGRVDLRSAELGATRSQGDSNWCFAVVAADLLSQNIGQRISLLDTGLLYYQQGKDPYQQPKSGTHADFRNWAMGSGADAFATLIAAGSVCSEAEMSASDYSPPEIPTDQMGFFGKLAHAFSSKQTKHFIDILYDLSDWKKEYGQDVSKSTEDTESLVSELLWVFPALTDADIRLALQYSKSPLEALNWLEQLGCKNRLSLPKTRIAMQRTELGQGHNLFPFIDNALEQGKIVGINYFLDPFVEGYVDGANSVTMNHNSSIVGRKFFDGDCHYLVRNSSDHGCDLLNVPCEDGNLWIPESDLNLYMGEAFVLQ